MHIIPENILAELEKRGKHVIPVVEFYPRETEDLVSVAAPINAVGRFSYKCFTWTTSEGSYQYDAKVLGFPAIEMFVTDQLNNAEISFSNVKRGEGSMARWVLNNHVKGMWMVIRIIFPDVPDESLVVFWGRCDRPGGINTSQLSITASQDMGRHGQKVPFRTYGVNCPLEFAKPLGGCLGNQTLEQKSPAYQATFAAYSTAGCNKLYSTCAQLGNTKYFQGQRVVAVSGQFSYVTIEEVIKRVLFWTKRKKVSVVKTESWSSNNQSEGNETVPIVFGRCQIAGQATVWADVGTTIRALYGFCEGKIHSFNFIRSRTEGLNITQTIQHLGDWGGTGTQNPDLLFNGASGYNSRLAYLEVTVSGSAPTDVDDAPLITAVIKGLEVPVPDAEGKYTLVEWTDNPVNILRFLLTDVRFGRIPESRIDDVAAINTFIDCEELVEDRSNSEFLVLPANEYNNYGVGYTRYRSTGHMTPERMVPESTYSSVSDNVSNLIPAPPGPDESGPEIRWYNPFEPYTVPARQNILRRKYTCNGALQEEVSLFDFINKFILPTFKGYLNYGFNGKIQIKNRQKADQAYLREDTAAGHSRLPVTNIRPWRDNLNGYLVIGVSKETAEVRKVVGFEYSYACDNMNISAVTTGGLVASTDNISGVTSGASGVGAIRLSGSPSRGNRIEVTFNTGDDAFTIFYVVDDNESLEVVALMLMSFLNANIQFSSYLTAYILPETPTWIYVRCESGNLVLDAPTEYSHEQTDEVMRVQAVFENCGELTANKSARFDNIIKDSFEWNENNTDEINSIEAKYVSAVDDFRTTLLAPRAAWDTIDLEGELVKEELDLTFVDNYWQAAYLAKGEAIDRIDGNIHFNFSTDMRAVGLELGDVIAVRHDSGDGALNYVPVWVTSKSLDMENFTVKLGCKLYLTAAFDFHVQPIDAFLTATLNPEEMPTTLPPTIGSAGGAGGGVEDPNYIRPNSEYYRQFEALGRYSPDGTDIV